MKIKSKIFNIIFNITKMFGYEQIIFQKYRARVNSSAFNVLPKFLNQEMEINFIDVGANKGQTIDQIIKLYPKARIYSFEPTPELINELRKRYAKQKKVSIYNCALGDYNGKINFYTSEFSATNSSLKPDIELYKKFDSLRVHDFEKLNEVEVPIITLNEWYIKEKLIENIDILKIDTQGTEYNVLKGALDLLNSKIKIVIFEGQFLSFYKNSIPFYKTIELLYENNFYFLDIFGYHYNINNKIQMVECDFMFINSNFYNFDTLNNIK